MESLQFIQINPQEFKDDIIKGLLSAMIKTKDDEALLTQQEVADFCRGHY